MKCPACGHTKSRVLGTRWFEGGAIRRRRECRKCGARWFTIESRVETKQVVVVEPEPEPKVYKF